MTFRVWIAIGLSVLSISLWAQEYLVAHAPNNEQWTSDIYFRTLLPDTEITLLGFTAANGNGPGTLAWTSEPLSVSEANRIVTPLEFQDLIDGRAFDFLMVQTNQPLGEGKVNFSEENVAHSTKVFAVDHYMPSANFNNITLTETVFAGIAFVVYNPEENPFQLRYRLTSKSGEILAERLIPEEGPAPTDRYTKVLGQAQSLFPDTPIPANARINVAVDGDAKIVNGILLQGEGKTMYGGEAEPVEADISFHKDISRILQKNCQSCHHEGGSAPFSLTEYEDVNQLRYGIHDEVEEGNMPPWKPNPDCGDFKYDNSLKPRDKELLLAWIRDDAPEGTLDLAPQPLEFDDGNWQIGIPDMDVTYSVPVEFERNLNRVPTNTCVYPLN